MEKLIRRDTIAFGTTVTPFPNLTQAKRASAYYNFRFEFDKEAVSGMVSLNLAPLTFNHQGPRIQPFTRFTPAPSRQIAEYLAPRPSKPDRLPGAKALYLIFAANPQKRHFEEVEALLLDVEVTADFGKLYKTPLLAGRINRFWGRYGLIELFYPENTEPVVTEPNGHVVDLGNTPTQLLQSAKFTFARALSLNPLYRLSKLFEPSNSLSPYNLPKDYSQINFEAINRN